MLQVTVKNATGSDHYVSSDYLPEYPFTLMRIPQYLKGRNPEKSDAVEKQHFKTYREAKEALRVLNSFRSVRTGEQWSRNYFVRCNYNTALITLSENGESVDLVLLANGH